MMTRTRPFFAAVYLDRVRKKIARGGAGSFARHNLLARDTNVHWMLSASLLDARVRLSSVVELDTFAGGPFPPVAPDPLLVS